jgi:hypothetical protein
MRKAHRGVARLRKQIAGKSDLGEIFSSKTIDLHFSVDDNGWRTGTPFWSPPWICFDLDVVRNQLFAPSLVA